jgi:hypothetical protein
MPASSRPTSPPIPGGVIASPFPPARPTEGEDLILSRPTAAVSARCPPVRPVQLARRMRRRNADVGPRRAARFRHPPGGVGAIGRRGAAP